VKVVAFLPVKGSSSRIENKNTKLLDGKPLFLHTLEKLISCDFIDEVYLDTESDQIINFASEMDCNVLRRDEGLASNLTDGNKLFMNEVRQVHADIYIQILCTSPFISIETIRAGISAISGGSEDFDSAVLVRKDKFYLWEKGTPAYDVENIPNSVDLPERTVETMGLYIVKRDAAIKSGRRVGFKPFMLEAKALEAVDVNWPDDFELASLIAAGERERSRKLLGNIKNQLSSCLLSDIFDDFQIKNCVIKGVAPNFHDARFLGRAKTLKLRLLEEGEDFHGIYDALKSYETIVPDDVILVQNEAPDFAYFGELNANLAIRSGAAAVVVGGKTRDSAEVRKTGLPVFSSGYTCQDVRKRATTDSINKAINIYGVTIMPNDLVYGDAEGVVVIPKKYEDKIIAEVFQRLSVEKKILVDISLGAAVDDLTKSYGFF
tara:strand:+ start:3081 stop:4382 length:1302 start_codon:yes stop_codon:yes gene_type:complete